MTDRNSLVARERCDSMLLLLLGCEVGFARFRDFVGDARPSVGRMPKALGGDKREDALRWLPGEAFDGDVRMSDADDVERISFTSAAC